MALDVEEWLRQCCEAYDFDIRGVFRRHGTTSWPLTVGGSRELEIALVEGGHILPLPKEPAALANVLEVSIVDFVLSKLEVQDGAEGLRGTERGYPDIELSGKLFGGGYHAVDVKVAKRAVNKRGAPTANTQSRITPLPATLTFGTRSCAGLALSDHSTSMPHISISWVFIRLLKRVCGVCMISS